jgi:hypothetical protein
VARELGDGADMVEMRVREEDGLDRLLEPR